MENADKSEPIFIEEKPGLVSENKEQLAESLPNAVENVEIFEPSVEKVTEEIDAINAETERQGEIINFVTDKVHSIQSELGIEVGGEIPSLNINKDKIQELNSSKERNIEWLKLNDPNFDENKFYRIVDEKGYKDFEESGVVRSSPTGTDSNIVGTIDIGHRPTSFPSFSKGSPDLTYAREGSDNFILESDVSMYRRGEVNPVTDKVIRGRHWAYRPIDDKTGGAINEMTPDMISNIYKLDQEGNIYIKKEKDEQIP